MGGYDYQIWSSIEAWLTLGEDEVLYLEGAEDIDRVSASDSTAIQIRRTKQAVSLNSESARDAIRNFWGTSEGARGRIVRFVYLTTSGIAMERDARFDGLTGVQAWSKAAFDPRLAEAVREHLVASLEPDHPAQVFLRSATVLQVQERLLRRFTWVTDQPDVGIVERSVLDRISDELTKLEQPVGAASAVKSALFEYCWKQVLKKEPEERRLDLPALRQQIRAATTLTFDLPMSASRGLVLATAQLGALQARFASLALLQSQPPSPPKALLRRPVLVQQVSRLLEQRCAVLLTGSAYKGKTTIAQIVARDAGLTATWTELAQRSPSAVADTLKLLAWTVDRHDGPTLLVLDDLDTSPQARRVYAPSLRQLVHRAALSGKSLLFTAQGHSEALEREVATEWGLEVVQVPKMTQREVAEHCTDFGCPTVQQADNWSRLIVGQTAGHPALVHVRLQELRADGWPKLSASALLGSSPATKEARQAARDLLGDSFGAAEAEFTLQASEFAVSPTRAMLLNLAGLPPVLPGAATVLSKLTGRWIEELGDDRFRVTPILKAEVGVTWTSEQHQGVQAKLCDAILRSDPLTPADAGALIFHSFLARDSRRLGLALYQILVADSEIQDQVLSHCTWLLALDTESADGLTAFGDTATSLRHLQFLAAASQEPSRLDEMARAWHREIGPPQDGIAWMATRMLYNMTVVFKQKGVSIDIVLDAASSAATAGEPFATQVREGLARATSQTPLEFGPPPTATPFQAFLSLHSGNVRTRRDLLNLSGWLSQSGNRDLAHEFDRMFEWPWVRDLGAFVHTAWVAESNRQQPDWAPWPEAFDDVLGVCQVVGLPLFAAQVARAKSIVLSEYMRDMEGGAAALVQAESVFGESATISEQRINLLGQQERHGEALAAWDALVERFGSGAITDPFALRRVAVSAGKLEQFSRASQLFEEGTRYLAKATHRTRVGLLADAAYAALRGEEHRRCSSLLAAAVLALPPEAAADGDKRWEAVIQVANAAAQLCESPGALRPDGAPVQIALGRGSAPDLEVDVSSEGQPLRVGFLETQVAFLEAQRGDAAGELFERAARHLSSVHPLLRVSASKALILREATLGASAALVTHVRALFDAAQGLNDLRLREGGDGVQELSLEDAVAGLLVLGLLLAKEKPGALLSSWEAKVDEVPWASMFRRLRAGLDMAPGTAVHEAARQESGDWLVCFGAALQLCRSETTQARGLAVASYRVAGAVNVGLALMLKKQLRPRIACLVADRLAEQLRLPAQFVAPALALPAIVETVQAVKSGNADIQQLLAVAGRVTGISFGESLRLL